MIAILSLGACGKDNGVDYCDNHYGFHTDHLDTIAELSIELTDSGDLDGRLMMPQAVFGDMAESDIRKLLGDAESTFVLQSEVPCRISVTNISSTDRKFEAQYAANCGTDNKLGRISVTLFDQLDGLEEVVASVTTSATSKRFAISRQCDAPIFRLD